MPQHLKVQEILWTLIYQNQIILPSKVPQAKFGKTSVTFCFSMLLCLPVSISSLQTPCFISFLLPPLFQSQLLFLHYAGNKYLSKFKKRRSSCLTHGTKPLFSHSKVSQSQLLQVLPQFHVITQTPFSPSQGFLPNISRCLNMELP